MVKITGVRFFLLAFRFFFERDKPFAATLLMSKPVRFSISSEVQHLLLFTVFIAESTTRCFLYNNLNEPTKQELFDPNRLNWNQDEFVQTMQEKVRKRVLRLAANQRESYFLKWFRKRLEENGVDLKTVLHGEARGLFNYIKNEGKIWMKKIKKFDKTHYFIPCFRSASLLGGSEGRTS